MILYGSYSWNRINHSYLTKWRRYQSGINILTPGKGFHSEELPGHLWKVDPNESGILEHFAFVRWNLDKEVSLDSVEEANLLVGWVWKVIPMDLQWAIFWMFIHWILNGSRKGYLRRRVQVFSLWGKEEVWHYSFIRTGRYWGVIGEQFLSDRGASDWMIAGNLWEIISTVRNEREVFILWHSVHMSWNYVDLRIKYTRRTQDWQKHLWIGPHISWPSPRRV